MKKKGFTLVELIGVITLLGIIALIIFPVVSKTINNSKERAYQQQVSEIIKATEHYTTENTETLYEIDTLYYNKIMVSSLIQKGYLKDKDIINPKTDEPMDGCVVVFFDKNNNQYKYEYNENCELNIPDYVYELMLNARKYYKENIKNATEKVNFNGATNLLKEIDNSNEFDGALYLDETGRSALAFVYNNVCYTKYFTTDYYQSNDVENCGLNIDFVVESSYVGFGGEYLDYFNEIISTSDGGYIALGRSNSYEYDGLIRRGEKINYDAIIVKYNEHGNILWSNNFGGNDSDYFERVIEEDDCYIVFGTSISYDGDLGDLVTEDKRRTMFVLKYNKQNGELMYKKILLAHSDDYYIGNVVKDDKYYYISVAGRDISGNSMGYVHVIKYDTDFNVIWAKPYGDRYGTQPKDMILTNHGTLFLVAQANSNGTTGEIADIWLPGIYYSYAFEIDKEDGSILGKISLGGSGTDIIEDLIEVEDGYIVVGYSDSNDGHFINQNKGETDAFIAKISKTVDTNGMFSIVWLKTFGGFLSESFTKVEINGDELIAMGTSNSSDYDMSGISIASNGYDDGIIVRYDLDGNIISKKAIGGNNQDSINGFVVNENNNYVLVGGVWSKDTYFKPFNYGNEDAYMMVVDNSLNPVEKLQVVPLLVNKLPELVSNYGTSIPRPEDKESLVLYTTNDPTTDLGGWCTSAAPDPNSNYNYVPCLYPFNGGDEKQLATQTIFYTNELSFEVQNPNNWIYILFSFSSAGSNNGITDLKIKFEGHDATTVEEAVNLGYVEPLVLVGSVSNSGYFFSDTFNLVTTGTSGKGNYAAARVIFKPKNMKLEKITFGSLKNIDNYTKARVTVIEFHNFDISLTRSK